MLDRKEVEKLGNLTGLAPFVRIPSPAFEELLRVYRAWLDAPVAWQNPLGGVLTNDAVRFDGTDTTGWKRVRLVRDGDSGEG